MPSSTARRTTRSMWPSATIVSGSTSSVTSRQWRESTPSSVSTGASAATSRKVEPSRNCTHMPARSLASASSREVVSWHESTPAAMYACRR